MGDTKTYRTPLTNADEALAKDVVDAGFHVHAAFGPGLLESVYEHCLALELVQRGHSVRRQVILPVKYRGADIESGYRLDMLVDERLIVEIKSIREVLPIHHAQLLTYLRLSKCRIGFLINFNCLLYRKGIRRFVVE
ncbi:MAG: GxxExxY protein [Micropepsaceae bacterium]